MKATEFQNFLTKGGRQKGRSQFVHSCGSRPSALANNRDVQPWLSRPKLFLGVEDSSVLNGRRSNVTLPGFGYGSTCA